VALEVLLVVVPPILLARSAWASCGTRVNEAVCADLRPEVLDEPERVLHLLDLPVSVEVPCCLLGAMQGEGELVALLLDK
jgi:hypothetical protein